ncbi:MAG: helix-turn-helix transcriptional regulator [Spirochaetes bacterium]|nr:helix-turn-helix transcriptional regulator [Spirochaetota bacterium]
MLFSAFFIETLPARHSSDEHAHGHCEIVFADGSGGYVIIDGNKIPYADGDVLVHRPGLKHIAYNEKASRHFCLGVKGWEIDTLRDGVHAGTDMIRAQFFEIEYELKEQRPYFKSMIEHKSSEIIIGIKRLEGMPLEDEHSPADKAKEYIDSHFSENISIALLSDNLMLSRDYLRHAFRKHHGVSPLQYLITKRIENAKLMLEQTGIRIRDAALRCGFENEYYFSRIFKKVEGISPREYRDRIVSLPGKASAHKEFRL